MYLSAFRRLLKVCGPHALVLCLQARGANIPLRVSGISPGVVETEFFTVRSVRWGKKGQSDRLAN